MKFFSTTVFILATLVSTPVHAAYDVGFIWQRETDWVSGVIPGSTTGNPASDKLGNPVWRYEFVSGGGMSSINPWYAEPGQLMVWDDSWWPSDIGVWARGYTGSGNDNNINPPINKWGMAHDISMTYDAWDYVPIVKWVNPVDDIAIININGMLDVNWEGRGGGPDIDVEVALVQYYLDGTIGVLYSDIFSNPEPNNTGRPFPKVNIPFSMSGLRVATGEQLGFSARAKGGPLNTENTNWILFGDRVQLKLVSVVPEPETYAMMIVGLAVLLHRVRRSKKITI